MNMDKAVEAIINDSFPRARELVPESYNALAEPVKNMLEIALPYLLEEEDNEPDPRSAT